MYTEHSVIAIAVVISVSSSVPSLFVFLLLFCQRGILSSLPGIKPSVFLFLMVVLKILLFFSKEEGRRRDRGDQVSLTGSLISTIFCLATRERLNIRLENRIAGFLQYRYARLKSILFKRKKFEFTLSFSTYKP